ncbi:hypothetical protein P175DRAFT_0470259 [Aspergillus ochraceoroseus IBT 24754]|uniref:Uncharacterized protein n=3 Tax=Aspergillus subgen. Nidulantes TaxID=2720870 RepID=A0A0F8X918_9EURO|nr:uncharacterized protein P175DRAFT_0470259 [Aspergillus ochraceoroseus IBT 24754]KKK12128.1 hypothetical protein AOCH_002664 [Aspergillus ochraceoroseus]KKK26060.1 hypothetical protein ARAM_005121 [Aspergillus rambellii]PTU24336.1 hypothetical protein P175DRAFT_0470259 [Aspergillus ochraceoroseus IBT 24754]
MSPVNSLWFKWKSLRLPWRRFFLVGSDLEGNTFWEFKDTLNAKRFRRIVKYSPKTHYADVQVSPQWHQWLRHVRVEPPSIEEQQQDIARRIQLNHLAQLANKRWESVPSLMDKPATKPQNPPTQPGDTTVGNASNAKDIPETQNSAPGKQPSAKEDPFFRPKGAPSENWQPEPWTPSTSQRQSG